jgi:hypothetical protein
MVQENPKHVYINCSQGLISQTGYKIHSNMQRYKSINNMSEDIKRLSYQPKLTAKLPSL